MLSRRASQTSGLSFDGPSTSAVKVGDSDLRDLAGKYFRAHILSRDFLLDGHQAAAAIRNGLRVDFFTQPVAFRVVYIRILEHPHPIQLCRFHEIAKFLE